MVDAADELKKAFRQWDADDSGTITREELSLVLRTLQPDFTHQEATILFDALDRNQDGVLNFEEFADFLYASPQLAEIVEPSCLPDGERKEGENSQSQSKVRTAMPQTFVPASLNGTFQYLSHGCAEAAFQDEDESDIQVYSRVFELLKVTHSDSQEKVVPRNKASGVLRLLGYSCPNLDWVQQTCVMLDDMYEREGGTDAFSFAVFKQFCKQYENRWQQEFGEQIEAAYRADLFKTTTTEEKDPETGKITKRQELEKESVQLLFETLSDVGVDTSPDALLEILQDANLEEVNSSTKHSDRSKSFVECLTGVATTVRRRHGFTKQEIVRFLLSYHGISKKHSLLQMFKEIVNWMGFTMEPDVLENALNEIGVVEGITDRRDLTDNLAIGFMKVCFSAEENTTRAYIRSGFHHYETTITYDQLPELLHHFGFSLMPETLLERIDQLSSVFAMEVNGGISISSFWRLLCDLRSNDGMQTSELRTYCDAFDRFKNSAMCVDRVGLTRGLRFLGLSPHPVTVTEMIHLEKAVDLTDDHLVQIFEFLRMVRLALEINMMNMEKIFRCFAKDKQVGFPPQGLVANDPNLLCQMLSCLHLAAGRDLFNQASEQVSFQLQHKKELRFFDFVSLVDAYRDCARKEMCDSALFTEKEIMKLKEKFRTWDADGSGSISGAELQTMLLEMFPDLARDESRHSRVSTLLQQVDINIFRKQDENALGHCISFDEFLWFSQLTMNEVISDKEAQAIEQSNYTMAEVEGFREIFKEIADQHTKTDDVLDANDVLTLLRRIVYVSKENEEELAKLVKKVNTDGDELIDFAEMLLLLRALQDKNFADINLEAQRLDEVRMMEEEAITQGGFSPDAVAEMRQVFEQQLGGQPIDGSQIEAMFGKVVELSEEQKLLMNDVMASCDDNGDRKLNLAEFIHFVSQLRKADFENDSINFEELMHGLKAKGEGREEKAVVPTKSKRGRKCQRARRG